jgi:hypothetical protein
MKVELITVKNHNEVLTKTLEYFLDYLEPKYNAIEYMKELVEIGVRHLEISMTEAEKLKNTKGIDLPFTDECHKAEREIYELLLKKT